MADQNGYVILTAGETSLVLECAIGERPNMLYWGPRLEAPDPDLIKAMTTRQHAPGCADTEIASSLLNETGTGMAGLSGFSAHRNGMAWASLFRVTRVLRPEPHRVEIVCEDEITKVRATHLIGLDPDSHVITCQTQIENSGDTALAIDWCASASLPLDPRATRLFGFTGRWSGEFHLEEIAPFLGSYLRENKSGRTSHDNFPGLLVGADVQGALKLFGRPSEETAVHVIGDGVISTSYRLALEAAGCAVSIHEPDEIALAAYGAVYRAITSKGL